MATPTAVGIIQCNFYSFTIWVSTLKVPHIHGFPVELSDQEHREPCPQVFYLKIGVLQPGGTHHFCLSNSTVLTLPARSQGGMERREEKKKPNKIRNLKSLTQVHQTS